MTCRVPTINGETTVCVDDYRRIAFQVPEAPPVDRNGNVMLWPYPSGSGVVMLIPREALINLEGEYVMEYLLGVTQDDAETLMAVFDRARRVQL